MAIETSIKEPVPEVIDYPRMVHTTRWIGLQTSMNRVIILKIKSEAMLMYYEEVGAIIDPQREFKSSLVEWDGVLTISNKGVES